ncbi:hypothetical protein [Ensifer sesbaniae]|jgi:hypothetical protein|uniref:hypothetical protein n=1 Tax=Ensifer sesbaniae TaxID=1214071 RepID=UPI003D7F371F
MSDLGVHAGLFLMALATATILPVQAEETLDWSVHNIGINGLASGRCFSVR